MVVYLLPGIFVMGYLVYIMDSYVIRCPEQTEWNIRAEIRCQNTRTYFCLYNYIAYSYEEGCTGPDWDRPGSKRVYSKNFNRRPCNDTRYQPINFVTNGNSDCIFRKSLCTEEGQILFTNGTTKTDSTCRCDYKQGYAFVTVPRNTCSCRPSEEDCSCYLKTCQGIGYYLSADYECTNDITKKTDCPSMSENPSKDPHIKMAPTGIPREHDSYAIKRKYHVVIVVLVCIFGMMVITMCFMFHQRLPRCLQQSTKKAVEAHIESERMDGGPSLDIIDQNATNNQPDGIRLEETVSGNKEIYQIALSERQQKCKCAIKEFEVNIEKEGLDAALKHLKEDLENWRNEPVKLAVTGKSGVGKSSFIKAIRNLKLGDPGSAATSCSGNTTKHPTVYEYAGNPKNTLHAFPGFGTTICSENEHKEIYIQSNLPKLNFDVVKRLMFGEISDEDFSDDDPSDDVMDIIYTKLKERALKITLTSKWLTTKPISNMDKKSIISLICNELLFYRKAFGFEQQCVKDIFKDDHIRQNLNASSIVEIQPTDEAMRKFVENKFIESGQDILRLLKQVLDGCRDDDKLIRLQQKKLRVNKKHSGFDVEVEEMNDFV